MYKGASPPTPNFNVDSFPKAISYLNATPRNQIHNIEIWGGGAPLRHNEIGFASFLAIIFGEVLLNLCRQP